LSSITTCNQNLAPSIPAAHMPTAEHTSSILYYKYFSQLYLLLLVTTKATIYCYTVLYPLSWQPSTKANHCFRVRCYLRCSNAVEELFKQLWEQPLP
jgi:hypothetical protein